MHKNMDTFERRIDYLGVSSDILIHAILWVLAIVAAGGVLAWTNSMDVERAASAAAYESCVKAEYGVSPQSWYYDHGEYPECDGTPYLDESL